MNKNSLKNLTYRFPKGFVPWNKGKKGIHLSPKTEFKKGDKAINPFKKGNSKPKNAYKFESGEKHPNYKHGLSKTLEYAKACNHNRRARKLKNGGSFTAQEWMELKKKSGNKCLACKRIDLKLVADHVIPLAKGGTNDIKNIQVLCSRCNNKKHIKDTDYRNMIEVSIIIPGYNQGEFACDSIESALNQTVPCEIIFVNDGSNDATLEIAKKYPIRVIDQVNQGLSSARNTGIMWATGDYVLPLDCDDILLPNAVEKIIEKIKETKADIIGLSFKEFGLRQTDIILMPEPTLEDFKTGNRIGYCSAIKREALLECGGYSPRMTFGWEDYHLWFDLLSRGKKIVTIPEILWLYRTKEYSMINEANAHGEELKTQIIKDFPHLFKLPTKTPLPNANS